MLVSEGSGAMCRKSLGASDHFAPAVANQMPVRSPQTSQGGSNTLLHEFFTNGTEKHAAFTTKIVKGKSMAAIEMINEMYGLLCQSNCKDGNNTGDHIIWERGLE